MVTSPSPAFRAAAANAAKAKYPPPFSIRFTWEERAELDRLAGHEPWSRYIRKAVFADATSKRRKPARQPRVDEAALAKTLGQLGASRLAANLNQIAKAAHIGTLPVTPELEGELHEACVEVKALRNALIAALGLNPKD